MNEDDYQMNYRMKVHMTSLRYWLFIRTCFHTSKTILVDTDLYSWLFISEKLPVIVTGRKRILPVTHKIVPDSDRWPVAISCAALHMKIYSFSMLGKDEIQDSWDDYWFYSISNSEIRYLLQVGNELDFSTRIFDLIMKFSLGQGAQTFCSFWTPGLPEGVPSNCSCPSVCPSVRPCVSL